MNVNAEPSYAVLWSLCGELPCMTDIGASVRQINHHYIIGGSQQQQLKQQLRHASSPAAARLPGL